MKTAVMSPIAIKKKGLLALKEALGLVGMVRFLQQFENGEGDYTKERAEWLKETSVKDIISKIKNK